MIKKVFSKSILKILYFDLYISKISKYIFIFFFFSYQKLMILHDFNEPKPIQFKNSKKEKFYP